MHEFFQYDALSSGSKGLVCIGNKILVYRRDHNTDLFPLLLDLPGGGPEGKETPFETFRREVNEEFSLRIKSEHIVYARRYPSELNPGKFAYFCVAKLPFEANHTISFGNEGLEYMTLTLEEYIQRKDAWPVFQDHAVDYMHSLN